MLFRCIVDEVKNGRMFVIDEQVCGGSSMAFLKAPSWHISEGI
jgi:hypothetical protein